MKTKITALDIASWGGFMAFACSGVITPICLPEISKSLSITLSEGGGIESARTFFLIAALLLAGLSAHKWGKKRLLTMGHHMLAAGLLLASFSQSYPMFIASLMIIGIGGGLIEALINPLVVDIHPDEPGKYLNITNAFYPIGVMASALLFGELLTLGYSWRIMFRIAAAAALAMGLFFNGSRFPAAAKSGRSAWSMIAAILGLWGFWLFAAAMFLGAAVESAFTFWSRSYVEAYLANVPRAGALAVVIFAGAMAAGRLLISQIPKTVSLRMIMIYSAILGVAVSGIVPFTSNLSGFYALLALAGIAAAAFWPTILAVAADSLKVDSTMLFVMLACVGIAGFGFTPWAMGVIGDHTHLRTSFFVIPGFFVLLVIIFVIEWRMSRKKITTPAVEN